MRPISLSLTLLVLTAACENTNDPFLFGQGGGGGGVITQAQATGSWSFTVTKSIGTICSTGALADGSVLTATLDVGADGTVNSSTSSWRSPSGIVLPLSGAVRLTDGRTDLHLSGGSGSGTGMEMIGTAAPGGTFTGTVSDPDPGLFPMFGSGACQYNAAGTKT